MRVTARSSKRRSQRGIALVLAIFTLMLISVIATSLILMTGTSAAIKANYKSSMQAFYDAKAGLEEGRSRLWPGNPASVSNCVFIGGNPMPVNQVCYITNPDAAAGETSIDPTNSSDPYADTEYASEFGSLGSAHVNSVPSNSPLTSPAIAGPLYKWVRITPRTEQSAGMNVDGTTPATDQHPLFYGVCPGCDPLNGLNQFVYSGVGTPENSSQVLTVTALAKTPTGGFSGTRLLQYTVAQNPNPLGQALIPPGSSVPPPLSQIFQAALTLDGNGVTYSGNGSKGLPVNGNDSNGAPGSGIGAIAYTNSHDPAPSCNCQSPSGIPGVATVTLPPQMQTPAGLSALVNTITEDASVVLTGPTDQSSLPSSMSAANPMIVVVNGDFHLTHANGNSAFTGYGLLLVTGTLYYDPDDSWNGVILVIGKGVFNGSQNGKNGQINGAVFVANILDSSGKVLTGPLLGPASFNGTGGGNGIHYGSRFVNNFQPGLPYQVLSFREIQQQ
jgi:Tfp pilus assembly protein PilX